MSFQAGQFDRVVLREQLGWLIRLGWIAAVFIVTTALTNSCAFRFWSIRVWTMLQVEAKAEAGVAVNVNLPRGRAGEPVPKDQPVGNGFGYPFQ